MNDNNKQLKIKFLPVTQPIGTFYIGVMDSEDLLRLSYVDVRTLLTGGDNDLEQITGIQRNLSQSRLKNLKKYVNLVDATFPTSVILHAEQEDVFYDEETSTITFLKDKGDVLQVLDGQHRLVGLKNYDKNKNDGEPFELNVTLFIGMEKEDQAITFATINKTHTKVNKSLVADLFEFATTRSPQKTAHNIVRVLNEQKNSPFEDKIKILGPANDPQKETITQATFVDQLIKYMSTDPVGDRDLYKRGKKPDKVTGADLEKRFFRNMFIEEREDDIARIIWRYFSAVEDKWPNAWGKVQPSMILNKSTGFVALMQFLAPVYLSLVNEIGEVPKTEDFSKVFNKIKIKEEDLNREVYKPGSSGVADLRKQMLTESGLS